jgi:hypothetical protein
LDELESVETLAQDRGNIRMLLEEGVPVRPAAVPE